MTLAALLQGFLYHQQLGTDQDSDNGMEAVGTVFVQDSFDMDGGTTHYVLQLFHPGVLTTLDPCGRPS